MIHAMFFLFGLMSMLAQILLIREILVIFHGTEISIGLFYAGWLLGIGCGALVGARAVRSAQSNHVDLFWCGLLAMGFSLPVQIVLVRSLPMIIGIAPAELAPLHGVALAVPVSTLLPSFLTGFLFPAGCAALREVFPKTLARLYVLESLGSLVGGLLFTFVLVKLADPLQVAALAGLLVSMAVLIASAVTRAIVWCSASGLLLMVCLGLLSPAGNAASGWSEALRWEALHPGLKLLDSRSSPYQHLEVARLGNQHSLLGNGKVIASFPDPQTADRLAALVMAQKPDTRQMLILGGGVGSLLAALLKYPIDRIDVLEPDPQALVLARSYMNRADGSALDDARVRVIHQDGRFYVNRLNSPTYDIILCTMPDPVSSFWNRYYTLEFFRAARSALRGPGILITRVTSSENFWGSEIASYAGSVYHTLKKVFPHVMGTPGDETFMFACGQAGVLSLDPDMLKQRYKSLEVSPFDPEAFTTLLQPERARFVRGELDKSPVLINTDFAPVSSSLAMVLWGRFSGTDWLDTIELVRRAGIWAYLIPLSVLLLARVAFRLRWGARGYAEGRFQALLAMACIGAAAMGMQVVLLYGYQSLFGHVFERIGLLTGLFMTGLAAGGFAAGAALGGPDRNDLALVLLLMVFAGFCPAVEVALTATAGSDPLMVEWTVFALSFIGGFLTGLGFPLVAALHLARSGNPAETSGLADAADHLGAAMGAALAGALMVPLMGVGRSCAVFSAVLAAPAVLLLLERFSGPLDRALSGLRPKTVGSFPYVRLRWALGVSVLAAFAWHWWIGAPAALSTVRFSDELLTRVSGSEKLDFRERPFPHYVGTSQEEPGFTVSLSTLPVASSVRGYGGPVNLLVSVYQDGTIRGVTLVESRETPAYIRGLDEWLAGFKGRSILKLANEPLDAISRATITCRAVNETLRLTGTGIAGPLLGIAQGGAASEPTVHDYSRLLQDPRLWAVSGMLVLFAAAFFGRSRLVRTVCLVVSVAVIGVYLNAPFTCLDVAAILRGEIPAAGTAWRTTLMMAVLAISVCFGQAFCGFMCPFGALQELLSFGKLRVRVSPGLEQAGRFLKFVLLAVLVCLFLLTDRTDWFGFSPLQQFFGWKMNGWVMALALTCLTASVLYLRFWCRYLCPAGAFLALFNKVRLLRRWAPVPVAGRCDLGVSSPDDVDCIKCHRCLMSK